MATLGGALFGALTACEGSPPWGVPPVATAERFAPVAPGAATRAQKPSGLAAGAPQIVGPPGPAHLASRCADCHGTVHGGWSESGHAQSNQGALYTAMRRQSEPAACDPCHAPLRMVLPPGDVLAEEGVTCDACHTLKDVAVGGPRATLTLALTDDVRWGTLCDAQEHYFHKTGCAPLFKESRLCAGCHRWSMTMPSGKSLEVLMEYTDWLTSPAAAAGTTCQGCHMPPMRGEVATGWTGRTSVHGHDLLGKGGSLRRNAVKLKVQVHVDGGQEIRAEVDLTNTSEAHAAPTGFPGRQLALEVTLLDAAEGKLARAARVYGRVLVDGAGQEVPFYEAHAQASDNRIAPGATRREAFSFQVGAAAAVRARVVWRAMSPTIAAKLGLPVEEQVLAEVLTPLRRAAKAAGAP
ncbi:hypothetical protein [Chondromyces apiculatus]|uniref:Uncharacterized protein n=1 Tax=Chondromyces apiculatus DSM 436 TaxID=1192034 RepID=A0A017TD03_9BACT|nr:hypothetical protein [Chondromyces apiculatus]EYF06807.1 Hypothetical protein CAP_1504 [Chondromyces apiculatus DSM 436]